MEEDDLLFARIESYLQGSLPEEEMRRFKAEIAENVELQSLVQQHRAERAVIREFTRTELITLMQELEAQLETGSALPHFSKRRIWWTTGIIILVIVSIVFLLRYCESHVPRPGVAPQQLSTTPSAPVVENLPVRPAIDSLNSPLRHKSLHSKRAIPDYIAMARKHWKGIELQRGRGNAVLSPLDSAKVAIESDSNDLAIRILSRLETVKPSVSNRFYLAHAHFKRGHFEEATALYKAVLDSGTGRYAEDAAWGYTLSLLAQMPRTKTELSEALSIIIESQWNENLKEEARQLKHKLKLM